MITTTTAIKLHPENETRFVSLNVSDTEDQTRAIIEAICEDASGARGAAPPDRSRWHALQKFLEGAEHRAVVPFAPALGSLIPPKAVRLRRDVSTVLGLIKAHAVLHQASRERDEEGRVVAILADYEAARRLVGESIDEGVESAVRASVREAVEAAGRLILEDDEGEIVSAKAIAAELGLDKSSASRRIRQALDAGYLRNLEDKKGRPMRLTRGDPMPPDVSILPSPEQIIAARPESPGDQNAVATVQLLAASGVPMPDTAVADQKAGIATAQPLAAAGGEASDDTGCTVADDRKTRATAPIPIDTGNTDNGCTVADQKAPGDENRPAGEAEPGSPAPGEALGVPEEEREPTDDEELAGRVRGEVEADARTAALLARWVSGGMGAGPIACSLAYNLYGTAARHKEVRPFVEELLEERRGPR